MAAGRPPLPEADRLKTRQVRMPEELAEKLIEITEVEGITCAAFLDELTRTEIENRHKANIRAITAMRKARETARKLREEPSFANQLDIGGEG